MSMYECKQCGEDHCVFPGVLLAINIPDKQYPYHENLFEVKYGEMVSHNMLQSYEGWPIFWNWLGEESGRMLWFCSKECAIKYLQEYEEKEK